MVDIATDVWVKFSRVAALGSQTDLDVAIATWRDFANAAEAEIENPSPFTDVSGLVRMYANAQFTRADFCELQGRLGEAEQLRALAIKMMSSYGSSDDQIEIRRQKANTLKTQARFAEALTELIAVEGEALARKDALAVGRVALDLAMLFEWLGDYERAEHSLLRAEHAVGTELEQLEPATNKSATLFAAVLNPSKTERQVALQSIKMELTHTRGMIAKRSGSIDAAITHFKAVLPAYTEWGTGPAIRFHLAQLAMLSENFSEALAEINTLKDAFNADPRFHQKIPVLNWLTAECILPDAPADALNIIESDYPQLLAAGDLEMAWKLRWTAAKALYMLGRQDDAAASYLEAAHVVDSLRRIPVGYRLESTYFSDRRPMFDEGIERCTNVEGADTVWRLMELAKSRSLATILYGERRPTPAAPLMKQFEELSQQIEIIDYRGFSGELTPLSQRNALVEQRAKIVEQIRTSDPRWRSVTQSLQLDRTVIRHGLGGAAALSLYITADQIVSTYLDSSGVQSGAVPLSVVLRKKLTGFARNIQRGEDPYSYDIENYFDPDFCINLSTFVPEKLINAIMVSERLVIISHDLLHLISWATLRTTDDRHLFEHTAVCVAPNMACLPTLAGKWSQQPTAAIVGAPDYSHLEYLSSVDTSGDEYESLCRLYGRPLIAISGAEVTEEALRQAITTSADITHISCHAVIDPIDPSTSALLTTDGRLDAAEIALLHLKTPEVILAACSTGYRPQKVGELHLAGDDIVGLPGAFLEAGVRSVRVSIPRAEDEATVVFVKRYHKNRKTHASPIKAFQQTQFDMLKDKNFELYRWCGFTLYGSPGL